MYTVFISTHKALSWPRPRKAKGEKDVMLLPRRCLQRCNDGESFENKKEADIIGDAQRACRIHLSQLLPLSHALSNAFDTYKNCSDARPAKELLFSVVRPLSLRSLVKGESG